MNKKVAGFAGAAVVVLLAAGCSFGGTSGGGTQASANNKETQAQSQDSYNLINNQPVPVYKYSQMRATEIDVQDIQANGEDTTSFFFNQGVANPIMSCVSRGMPVPASAQLTNPSQIRWNSGGSGGSYGVAGVTISQMDPTGVYTGDTTGTNVLCINSKGQEYIQYWEGFVDAVSGPATWNSTTHQIQLLGAPDHLNASSQLKH